MPSLDTDSVRSEIADAPDAQAQETPKEVQSA